MEAKSERVDKSGIEQRRTEIKGQERGVVL